MQCDNQPRTCNKCGHDDHVIVNCHTHIHDRKNIVDLYEFMPISFSDHNCVIVELDVDCNVGMENYYWKLNAILLELGGVVEKTKLWNNMVQIKNKFQNIIDWWENCVKVTVKHFFHKKSIEESHLKHGLIQYMESKLHKMYRNINESNTLDMKEVNRLNEKNQIKDGIL